MVVECDSACSWAIRVYEKLKTDFEAKQILTWHEGSGQYAGLADNIDEDDILMRCRDCAVERGCCKKRKLTLAITSQILDWFKRHQQELSSIDNL